ncbi:PDZ domain-containing protein [Bacillus ginsengihumi]|uniref:PDZ domain-containing protein n=1 Tax=Heyndrickxia ginsengihumi TaxID=363870 RepID=A0A0A6VE46_9BACI|nr:trypsin-like peptidase domain-containing protein [Heyndrickxia ginsengihumi]KHD84794.1 serine protease [Heyndrickxia ginsengihumi]MBE6184978.1 PDZ domain-containing protein [Bacillus sp. (in: firmicutes)]MCM3024134.1 trypsin-like peptidase domain-containing protein [Heyndrickxia ginsengihumi]NEY18582.1 PDZ domain-containing protein [Heyndrickxia ginsengihumi]
MGYYDENHQEGRHQPNKRGGKLGYFITGLVGVIVGALIVTFAFPSVLKNYDTSSSVSDTSTSNNIGTNNTSTTAKNVSLNVSTDITKAVAKTEKAVVGVANIQKQSVWSTSDIYGDDSGSSSSSSSQEEGSGSGIIYKKTGDKAYIVTNYHVIEGADSLEVTLSTGKKLPAKLVGGDVWTDLAVLQIDGKDVDTVAQFGNSDTLKLGESVIAIGNPLGEQFSGSVTQGIVSGLNRTVPVDLNEDGTEDWQEEVIQTDAAINPGNSGGALINIAGQVVGINSMKISQESVEGIGFSIPINSAKTVINELETKGKIERPAMGVELQNVSDVPAYHQQETLKLPKNVTDGVMIASVTSNSPAAKAGLKELDVIYQLDGHKISDIISLRKYLYENKKPGDKIQVKVYRSGKSKTFTLTLTTASGTN